VQHLIAFSAVILLGVAIVGAQGTNDPKAPLAKAPPGARTGNAATRDATPTDSKTNGHRDAGQLRRRGHGLGFEVTAKGDQGLWVSSVDENSPAAQAGLKMNDRIVSVDGRPLTAARQLQAYLSGQGGRRVPIIVARDGQQYTVQFMPPTFGADSAWLGVYLEEGDANMKGAKITHVYPAGPAARAGLYAGDIVTRIADQQIDGSADLVATVQQMEPQKQVEFIVLRNERETKIPVVLGSREAFVHRHHDRHDHGNDNEFGDTDRNDFDDVPPYAMQLEHDRRAAEQHQRIEEEIRLLREEIAKLREDLKRK
jgi:C-terminal processing protease CtpA/Prc